MPALLMPALLTAILLFILFFPLDYLRRRNIPSLPDQLVDERNIIFSRMQRQPGTPTYEDYYSHNPGLKIRDDRIRGMPGLSEPGGKYFHEKIMAEAKRFFRDIDEFQVDRARIAEWKPRLLNSDSPAEILAQFARELGAVESGTTRFSPEIMYSHKGRLDEVYGAQILREHDHLFVFLVEMDYRPMQESPRAAAYRESARRYYHAAEIAFSLSALLEECGFPAKPHYDAHYDMMLVPAAVYAGLGELGRNNILIADRFGSRVRIGAVSTSLKLPQGKFKHLGVRHFCTICRICAENCPSHSLSMDDPVEIRGVFKWPTQTESCYTYWRSIGTDCGVCMACCPYSHKNNVLHNMVRKGIRLNPWVRYIALKSDGWIYGRKWERRKRGFLQEL